MGMILYIISIFVALILMAQNGLFEPIPLMLLGYGLWAVTSLISICYRRSNGSIPDNLFQHFFLGLYWQLFLFGVWLIFSEGRIFAAIVAFLIAWLCIDLAGSIRNIRLESRRNRILPYGVGFTKNSITGELKRTIRPEVAHLYEDN